MLMLAAGWLAEVSLGKLIVLLIGAVILVPVIMVMLVGIIVGSFAMIAAGISGVPPWAPHARRDLAPGGESVIRRFSRGALTWGLALLFVGLALAYGLAAGLTESSLAVVTLVLVGLGAGLLVSCLVQALSGRSQRKVNNDTQRADDA